MSEDFKKAVAERLAKKKEEMEEEKEKLKEAVRKRVLEEESKKEEEKEKLKEAVRRRVLEEESKKVYQETPYGVFGVREGVYQTVMPRYKDSPSISPPLKFVASNIPNFEKFIAEKKIERVAGRKSRRSRKPKNKKNRSTRRR